MLRWLAWVLFLPLLLPWRLLQLVVDRAFPTKALSLHLTGKLADIAPAPLFGGGGPSLLNILLALDRAARDPSLERVFVTLDEPQLGLGQAEELREALAKVRDAGKQVTLHADSLGLAGYWVALGASRIVLSPLGSLEVSGIASEFTLLKGLLDKVGLGARLAARGQYKSMREVFSADEMSPANREMLHSLVADLYAALCERVAQSRQLPEHVVRETLDEGPFNAQTAVQLRWVDELAYRDELSKRFEADGKPRTLSCERYNQRASRRWTPRQPVAVALLEVQGNIHQGKDSVGMRGRRATGSRSFVEAARRVAEDPQIRGILLRVNSPGGSALASDLMWHALGNAQKGRPLRVSMGDVAASGGYYVSAVPGARLFASATTLTGSIGVVGGKWEGVELLDKLGIKRELISQGRHAAFHSPSVAWGPEEFAKLERELDHTYTDFVRKMADARGQSYEQLEQVAQGRVWTGAQALELCLIDGRGGMLAALESLKAELGVAPERPVTFKRVTRTNRWRLLQARLSPAEQLGQLLPDVCGDAWQLRDERLWCRLPFDIELS
jgi:protease-4